MGRGRGLFLAVVGYSVCVLLTGCGANFGPGPVASSIGSIQGVVHGGQQPVVGSHVYLYAAGTSGYGGPGLAPAASNASLSLLTPAVLTNAPGKSGVDANGNYYVTTDASGGFSLSGDYTCTSGTQVYIYAVGGNPGAGTNNAVGMLAVLGQCPASGSLASTVPSVFMDEVTTVAAAYAFAGFASDATHVGSSGTALAQTGIANAFANAANLVDVWTGQARYQPQSYNGYVPTYTINTLANILAACVNSSGALNGPSNPTACYTLLNNAQSAGASGTLPTDTATAAINIAHHPGVNVAALYGLQGPKPPFDGSSVQPNDFTLGIYFNGGGMDGPGDLAVDSQGNVWVVSSSGPGLTGRGSVAKFSPLGAVLVNADNSGGIGQPYYIAVDDFDNAWVTNTLGHESVVKLSSSGSALITLGSAETLGPGLAIDASGNVWGSGFDSVDEISNSGSTVLSGDTNGNPNEAAGFAIDGSGSAWFVNLNNYSVSKVSSSGAALITNDTAGGLGYSFYFLTIDNAGSVWIANEATNTVTKLSNAGAVLSGSGFTGGGLNGPVRVAMDGAGDAWISNSGGSGVTELSNAGAVLSPNGYDGSGYLYQSLHLAVDGSGDVWVTTTGYYGGVTFVEMIGAAVPVITPICAGLPATPTTDGSSNLGMRP